MFERFRGFLLFLSTAVDDRIRMSPTVIHVARRRLSCHCRYDGHDGERERARETGPIHRRKHQGKST